jgi:hypothetical protein
MHGDIAFLVKIWNHTGIHVSRREIRFSVHRSIELAKRIPEKQGYQIPTVIANRTLSETDDHAYPAGNRTFLDVEKSKTSARGRPDPYSVGVPSQCISTSLTSSGPRAYESARIGDSSSARFRHVPPIGFGPIEALHLLQGDESAVGKKGVGVYTR